MEGLDNFVKSLDRYRTGMCPLSELAEAHLVLGKFKNFEQYLSDGNVRAKDKKYSVVQEEALSSFTKLLKSKDYESADNVSFSVSAFL